MKKLSKKGEKRLHTSGCCAKTYAILDPELLNQIPDSIRPRVEAAFLHLQIQNRFLSEALRMERIRKFGPSSERLTTDQVELLTLEPVVTAQEVPSEVARPEPVKGPETQPRKAPVREALPEYLPRQKRIIHVAPDQCLCGQCGGEKKVIGYDRSERLNVRPAEYYVLETLREKRACPKCEERGVSVAAVPPSIVEKGILGDGLVIDAILRKFCDHNPFYRQAASIERDAGVPVSQATLGSAVLRAGELLRCVSAAMRAELLAGEYIQADETTVPVRSEKTVGRNHQGYLWEYGRPGGPVVYNFRMGREREGPRSFLGKFNGKLQSDGYQGYDEIGGKGLVHFGCFAHARRKFVDAAKLDPKDEQCAWILEQIRQLYAVESEAREAGLDVVGREALRRQKSVGLLKGIQEAIESARADALPQSALGKACAYALGQWTRLARYAEAGNGIVEIDNNWAENAMRGVALGRKNWLHVGSEEAGPKMAAIYSVVETCKRLEINPREYLEAVLPGLGAVTTSRVSDLTPMAWKRARSQPTA